MARHRSHGTAEVHRMHLWVLGLLGLVLASGIVPAARAQVPPPRFTPNVDLTDAAYARKLLALPDGGLVVAGTVTRANGTPRFSLARFNADGTLHAWNPAPNNAVSALMIDATGRLYVGGFFTSIAGVARTRIARFDASGVFDPSFAPQIANGGVNAISAGLTGEICFGGTFTQVGAVTRNRLACVLEADGSLNATWNPNANNTVSQLIAAGSNLYASGYFTNVGGLARNYVARLSLTGVGTADGWNPNANGSVLALLVDATGVYLGGFFSSVGGLTRAAIAKVDVVTGAAVSAFNAQAVSPDAALGIVADGAGGVIAAGSFKALGGQPRRNIARLNGSTGAAVSGWNPGIEYGYATQLVAEASGDYVVGGPFSSTGSGEHVGLARIDALGNVDPAYNPRLEQAGYAFVLARNPVDGSTIVGGRFVRADGFIRRNIFKLLPPGRVDPNWAPHTDAEVRALAVDAIGRVYMGGFFEYAGGLDRPFLARVQATSDGSIDAAWNPQPSNTVYHLLMRNDGLYASGVFNTIGGTPRAGLARFSAASGAFDVGWYPNPNSFVGQVASASDGTLLVSGSFTTIGGGTRASLAKLSTGAAATLDTSWTPTVVGGSVNFIAVDGDDAYVIGSFTTLNGEPRGGIGKLSTLGSGAVNLAWAPTIGANTQKILPTSKGVYVGGYFTQVNGATQPYLARLDKSTGATDPTWQSAVNNPVFDLLPDGNSLFVAGLFGSLAGETRQGLGRLPEAGDTIFTDDFDG